MQALENLKRLKRGNVLAGALAGIVAGLVMAAIIGSPMGLLNGVLVGLLVAQTRRRYMEALSKRVESNGTTWDVQTDGVKVGEITDAEFARLRLKVFADWRVYAFQIGNVLHGLSKVLDALFIALPAMVFWCVIAAVLFKPGVTGELLRQAQAISPEQLVVGLRAALWTLPFAALIYAGLGSLVGAKFGFVNKFTERSDDMLRWKLGLVKTGRLSLVRVQEGDMIWNDEAAFLKRKPAQ